MGGSVGVTCIDLALLARSSSTLSGVVDNMARARVVNSTQGCGAGALG